MAENEKRLQFLTTLLAQTCTNKHELARLMGMSPQNVFVYFQRDDMKLSLAQEIADKLGYSLSFTLENRQKSSAKVLLDIESILGEDGIQRLAFLQVAMKLNGIARKTLAEQLELNYTGVNRWFKVDDIAISYIFKIAELYGLKVCIKAEKKRTEPDVLTLS